MSQDIAWGLRARYDPRSPSGPVGWDLPSFPLSPVGATFKVELAPNLVLRKDDPGIVLTASEALARDGCATGGTASTLWA
jgi:hypothetical protein